MFKKCKVVMLPTEKAKGVREICLWRSDMTNKFKYSFTGYAEHEIEGVTKYHLYILSDDEIKEGDWYIYKNELISQYKSEFNPSAASFPYNKKIIATTDYLLNLPRPSDSFIRKYCELGGVDEVLVEYYLDRYNLKETEWGGWKRDENSAILFIKVSPDNTITIKKVKDSWNREEVEKICRAAFSAGVDKGMVLSKFKEEILSDRCDEDKANKEFDAVPTENKWIEENL